MRLRFLFIHFPMYRQHFLTVHLMLYTIGIRYYRRPESDFNRVYAVLDYRVWILISLAIIVKAVGIIGDGSRPKKKNTNLTGFLV